MIKLNIRRKVVLTSLVALVLAIIIVSAFAVTSSRSIILEGTIERELPAVLGEVANDLDAQLLMPITVSRVMASNLDYQNFIRNGEQKSEQDKAINYLAQVKREFNTITSFFVSAKTGQYFTPDGIFKTMSKSDDKDQWFYRFLSSGLEYELSLDVDEVTKIPTLFINYLMTLDNEPVAVAGVGLSLKNLSDSISKYRIGDQGRVFLVDEKGVIKLHPDTSQIGKSITSLGNIDSTRILTKGTFASTEYDKGGADILVASRYLPDIRWYLIAQVPSTEVFGALDQATWSLVVMGLVIALVFMLASTWFINLLISPFSELAEMLEGIGQGGGDLTKRLDDTRQDEVGKMATGYNQFVTYLSQLLKEVSDTGHMLYEAIERIDHQAKHMESEFNEQVRRIEQIATAMHEMGGTAEEIARSANNAAETAQVADSTVQQGDASVRKTINSVTDMSEQLQRTSDNVQQLADDANAIDTVLEVIRGVSEQTNLLALNAAIEAARAGDQGRGFAVVADEVRTLASRSHDSAEEISKIIENLQLKTGEVVTAITKSTELSASSQEEASNSGNHLQGVAESISVMNDMNLQIASATGEQSKVVGEINPHVTAVADISRQSSEVVLQTSADCSNLRTMALQLNELVSRFKFQ